MNDNVILRTRDVALCLHYAKRNILFFNRIQLQKIIYLLDCVDSFFYILLYEKGHQTYYRGPYDKNIQNATDILVFHLLIDVDNIRILKNGDISCRYSLTNNGNKWISSLLEKNLNTQNRFKIITGLLDSLLSRGLLKNIVNLVYAEPIFVKNQRSGYGVNLDFKDLDQNDVFSFMTIVLDAFSKKKQNDYVPFVCDLLISYLDERSLFLDTTNEEE